ncbi:serine/threonine protein kinase [Actinomadura rudentiformis]|uniref:Serine/threonine protein kinase n=1 Tax=Actinomadura rudentiformis TaxID=359158 RepID=A0A6H9YSG0_9ACTN|nr:serine/threonine-protein kinase [Actinomadura rudentiformis]KAB2348383.1 serine/threonine protein kinase [Actinomadura rudentiformis]
MAEALPLQPGDPQRLGDYEITGRLGVGEQGAVFLGRSPAGGTVAVKLLHLRLSGEPAARARFAGAFASARRVSGFCTAAIIDADVESDRPYVVSEYVAGPSLHQLVAEEGPRGGAVTERLAAGMAIALAAAHRAGAVHHDFKPGNVLLGRDGPRVTDLGVARALEAVTAAPTGRVADDPCYKSPEQLRGVGIGPAADMFAWGATLLFAVTGSAPFGEDSQSEVMQRIVYDEPDVSVLPESLREVVGDTLAKEPEDRPTARDVLDRLLGEDGTLAGRLPERMVAEGRGLAEGTAPIPGLSSIGSPAQQPQPAITVRPPISVSPAVRNEMEVTRNEMEVTRPERPAAAWVAQAPPASRSEEATQAMPALPPSPAGAPPAGGAPAGAAPATPSSPPSSPGPAESPGRMPHLIPGMDTGAQQLPDDRHQHTAVLAAPPVSRRPRIPKFRRPDNHVLGVAASLTIGVLVGIAIIALVLWPQLNGDSGEQPQARPANDDRPVSTIPESFAGTWKGTAVNARSAASFSIEVTFQVGGKVAQARFNNCVGTLALTSGTTQRLEMSLTVAKPCTSGSVRVVRQSDGTLQYMWMHQAGANPGYQGKLKKN